MIPPFRDFVAVCNDTLPVIDPLYEFGSRIPAGQHGIANLRPMFPGRDYVGCDYIDGEGVDRILDLHALDLPDESVGTALLIAVIEHVEFPREAIRELYRVLKPGGWFAMASHMNFQIHAHPYDYWRFTPEGFKSLLSDFQSVIVEIAGEDPLNPQSVVAVAAKGPMDLSTTADALRVWRTRHSTGWRTSVKPFIPPIAWNVARKLFAR